MCKQKAPMMSSPVYDSIVVVTWSILRHTSARAIYMGTRSELLWELRHRWLVYRNRCVKSEPNIPGSNQTSPPHSTWSWCLFSSHLGDHSCKLHHYLDAFTRYVAVWDEMMDGSIMLLHRLPLWSTLVLERYDLRYLSDLCTLRQMCLAALTTGTCTKDYGSTAIVGLISSIHNDQTTCWFTLYINEFYFEGRREIKEALDTR